MSMIKIGKGTAKRAMCVLTAGMMLFSAGAFTGCGSNSSSGGGGKTIVNQQEAMKTLAYKVSEVELENSDDLSYGGLTYKNGKYYVINNTYAKKGENYFVDYDIFIYDENGKLAKQFNVYTQQDQDTYGGISGNLHVDDSGTITCMTYINKTDPNTGEMLENKYSLVKYDSDGNKLSEQDMGSLITKEDNDNGMYMQGFLFDSAGNIYLNLQYCIRVVDSSGKKLFDTEKMSWEQNVWMGSMFLTNNGVPAVYVNEYGETSKTTIREIDINAKGFGKEYDISSINNTNNLYQGSGDYLAYFSTATGISGLRADTLTAEPVLNLLNLGIDNSYVSDFTICEDGSFLTVGTDYRSGRSTRRVSKIYPVDASEVKEKKILSLGCFYMDWNLRSQVADFNKKNEDYTIFVTSFSDNNDTSDWQSALTKFNNELMAGNVPDILLINNNMPVNSYISKGLFCDMYELMNKDTELTKDMFMPNVLTALETNGKLYEISPSFTIQTFAAKTSIVGTEPRITVSGAQDCLSKLPEGARLFSQQLTASGFLSEGIWYSDFIDYEKGKCSFDTPEFKQYLAMAKTFPVEIDYDKLYADNPNYWEEEEFGVRNNKALLYPVYMSGFSEYTQIREGYVGEETTLVGFPVSGEGTSGAFISPSMELAISSKSAFKEGAWEFIKSLIKGAVTEESYKVWSDQKGDVIDTGKMRYNSVYYGFPVLTSQLDQLASQATVPDIYYDANGKEVEQESTIYVGNQEIKAKVTAEHVQTVRDYIGSINRIMRYDTNISNIIEEESKLYFSGAKNEDETAAVIQSRVSLYLNEQY